MKQQTLSEIKEDEVTEAIEIAEAELGHDIREAYLNVSKATQKKADKILMDIRALHDNREDDEDDKSLAIFAKVLNLETVLGLCRSFFLKNKKKPSKV